MYGRGHNERIIGDVLREGENRKKVHARGVSSRIALYRLSLPTSKRADNELVFYLPRSSSSTNSGTAGMTTRRLSMSTARQLSRPYGIGPQLVSADLLIEQAPPSTQSRHLIKASKTSEVSTQTHTFFIALINGRAYLPTRAVRCLGGTTRG